VDPPPVEPLLSFVQLEVEGGARAVASGTVAIGHDVESTGVVGTRVICDSDVGAVAAYGTSAMDEVARDHLDKGEELAFSAPVVYPGLTRAPCSLVLLLDTESGEHEPLEACFDGEGLERRVCGATLKAVDERRPESNPLAPAVVDTVRVATVAEGGLEISTVVRLFEPPQSGVAIELAARCEIDGGEHIESSFVDLDTDPFPRVLGERRVVSETLIPSKMFEGAAARCSVSVRKGRRRAPRTVMWQGCYDGGKLGEGPCDGGASEGDTE
jgi:hypothetical protein